MFRRPKLRAIYIITSLLVFFLTVFFLLSISAHGTGDKTPTLTLTPATLHIDPLSKGETYEGSFSLSNSDESKSVKVKVYAAPYSLEVGDYDKPDFITQGEMNQIAEWITFPETQITVPPSETIDIAFKITVPEDADIDAGGQYAAIFAETTDDSLVGGVIPEARLGMIIYAGIDGKTQIESEITDVNFSGIWHYGNSPTSTFIIKNSGNIDISVKYRLEAESLIKGSTEDFIGEQKSAEVLPLTSRTLKTSWQTPPVFGIYKMNLNIQAEETQYTYSRIAVFFPIWGVFATLSVFFIIIAVIRNARQRKA
ncbi:MAG: DUF916 domain-containing protein [Lachnospiraceae bacterium]|jgi:hypothetical protein|nr:DUF916 domain-containing protein [Lachnospiraceae bacterium]